jgi:serralysin
MTQDGDQAFTVVDAFTGHAGELVIEVVGDTTFIRIDRNGSGVADPTELTLSGDHGDFDAFVL